MISVFCSLLCHPLPPLWLSASQLSAVLLFEVLLFSVVDAEVGIRWEMKRRNNIASFKTLVAFYVSLVKINSRKLEARASCSLTKHEQPAEREITGNFQMNPCLQVHVSFDCRGKDDMLSLNVSCELYECKIFLPLKKENEETFNAHCKL